MPRSRIYSSALALVCALLLSAPALLAPRDAEAFCGFYVSGADQEMFNNATMVVMMRDGTQTVLSMQNNYQGPPNDFAMVIPVPQVLEEENVKVLEDEVFDKVDQLAAPRLVEYWEKDPCYKPDLDPRGRVFSSPSDKRSKKKREGSKELGVKIEAQFDVGEYNVVVLSAKESNGLETWLKGNEYNIPDGAAPALKPYIEQGLYFFVAKVDPKKVSFEDGQAMLSPLRFHYDSEDFFLPVRLGLLNAQGHQDLLVHILAKKQRYEVANYDNVTIPTNLIVKDAVREQFAQFYTALFDYTLEENPGSVVTEYSWTATSCDPCPTQPLGDSELYTLGLDVISGKPAPKPTPSAPSAPARPPGGLFFGNVGGQGWTLTRLHARYTAEDLKEDLVFKKAPAIVGGRGTPQGVETTVPEGVQEASTNNFQGRYIMLNPWEGKIDCENPQRGIWGGPPSGGSEPVKPAQGTAFVKKRDAIKLASVIDQETVPGLKRFPPEQGATSAGDEADEEKPTAEDPKQTPPEADKDATEKSGGRCAAAPGSAPTSPLVALLAVLGLSGLRRRRR